MSPVIFTDWRWRCPTCARFIAESAVTQTVVRDTFNTYYGIRDVVSATCAKCGLVEPQYVPIRWEDEVVTG